MIKASFALSETGSVREENQDSYLLDSRNGHFAVADGLGGLPNGARASRMTIDVLKRTLGEHPFLPLAEILTIVNQETRSVGFVLDPAGFGTTLTMARHRPSLGILELGHIGDSAALLVRDGKVQVLTVEHTVAARMVAEQWQDAAEAIPPSAHHTLTQCIGQELYIDPQIAEVPVSPGDRFFLLTDGITKPVTDHELRRTVCARDSLERICQNLTFRAEAAGSPDNYTIVAVEF